MWLKLSYLRSMLSATSSLMPTTSGQKMSLRGVDPTDKGKSIPKSDVLSSTMSGWTRRTNRAHGPSSIMTLHSAVGAPARSRVVMSGSASLETFLARIARFESRPCHRDYTPMNVSNARRPHADYTAYLPRRLWLKWWKKRSRLQ